MCAKLAKTTTQTESSLERAVDVFLAHRTRLFLVAFRVTGDQSMAEDVVQEAWLRWQRTDRTAIQNPAAFLTTTTTRLAINLIQSARHRHEIPAGSLLAEPVDPGLDPARRSEQTAAVEQALAALMARLNSTELAAYVLRRGFDYAYRDVAAALRTSVPNARQLVRRAQLRLEDDRVQRVDRQGHRLLTGAFFRAAGTGDLTDLMQALLGQRASDGCPLLSKPTTARPAGPVGTPHTE